MGLFNRFRAGKAREASAIQDEPVRPVSFENSIPVVGEPFVWSLSRPPIGIDPVTTVTPEPTGVDDASLVMRVQSAYRVAVGLHENSGSFWDTAFEDIRRPVHDALISTVSATSVLRDPAENSHFWGFDAVCKAPPGEVEPHELVMRNMKSECDWKTLYSRWLHDGLISLSEAVGARRTFYPETTPGYHYDLYGKGSDVDAVLDDIEKEIGKPLIFPNPYRGEFGLQSRRGVIGFRSLQAVYQAWRLIQISGGRPDFRVVEIGAGLGRTAYFASQFGLTDYTIIDIPLTNAAQGYFLGRALGPHQLSLFGEASMGKIRILPAHAIDGMTETFDMLLNVDSLTELSQATAVNYWHFARANADAMLSVNHELNPHPVRTLYRADPAVRCARHPYWMRRGYVEEHVTWSHRRARGSTIVE